MLGALRFWLDRGVDGFRVDVMWETVKDEQLRDNPPNPAYKEGETNPYFRVLPLYNHDRPETHEQVRMMRRVLDEYEDKVMIGEIYLPITQLVTYYGTPEAPEAHMPANFHLLLSRWDARRIETLIKEYESALPPHGWPNWVLGNHDRPRIATKAGAEQAGVAAILLLTLRGTPTMYYADELGLEDVPIPADMVQDPVEHNVPGMGLGRDPERTPMQWDTSENAGFSTEHPWLPLSPDWRTRNVAVMRDDPASILSLYRRLIALRRAEPALTIGRIKHLEAGGSVLAYLREADDRRFMIAVNLGNEAGAVRAGSTSGRILVATDIRREGTEASGDVQLAANEGIVVEVI
jgi:alpha-glucosidase